MLESVFQYFGIVMEKLIALWDQMSWIVPVISITWWSVKQILTAHCACHFCGLAQDTHIVLHLMTLCALSLQQHTQ